MANRRLIIALCCFCLFLGTGWTREERIVTVYGSTTCISRFLEPGVSDFEKATKHTYRTVGVGTGQGLFALLEGLTEVSAASEELIEAIESAKQYAASKKRIVTIPTNLQYHKIAEDEVVVIVYKDNPVPGLTWKQLKGINSGAIKNWKEVGGPNIPIKVVTSHDGSATRKFFQKRVMDGASYVANAVTVWTTEEEIREVSKDQGAIGAVSITFHAKAPLNTRRLTTERIVRPLGLITVGQPSPKVYEVIDFFMLGEGRKYVK